MAADGPGRIALIRHGETEWSASGRHTSVTDIPLTPRGERQARQVPDILAMLGIAPATVIVSPRLRARHTAEYAGLVGTVDPDLTEWNYGDYEGLTTPEIDANRKGWSLFTDGAPGGESPAQTAARADRVLARASTKLPDGDVALICHGHISRILAVRWVGLPPSAGGIVALDPACVTVLGTYRDAPIIEHSNVPSPEAARPGKRGTT